MKKGRHIFIVVLSVLMGVAFLTSAFLLTNGRKARFNADGYCLEVMADENDTKVNQLLFATNSKYAESFPASYSYKDVAGKNVKVEKNSFIHYSDGSVSSFVNGVIVNMQEVAKGYMEFYSLEPGMVMTRNTSGYKIDANGHDLPFNEICWELADDKVLLGGNSMTLKLGTQQPIKVEDYAEVKWIEDNIVQIATKDKAYQVVAKNSYVEFTSGSRIDLFDKVALSEAGLPMFSLNDMAADLKTAIPVSSTSYLEWNIPKFNITSEDGKQGEDGKEGEVGETGEEGESGEEGKTGEPGVLGASGGNGLPGISGGRREESLGGDGDRLARINVGVVDTSNPTSASFTLTIDDAKATLHESGGVIEVRDAKTNNLVWSRKVNLSGISPDLTYNVGGLEADHEYTIFVKHGYEADINGSTIVGTKIFSRRNFSTSSEGLSATVISTTKDVIGLEISKSEAFDAKAINVRIWNGSKRYVDYPNDFEGKIEEPFPPTNKIVIDEIELGKIFRNKYPDADTDFTSNIDYRIEFMKNCQMTTDSEGNSVIVGDSCVATLSGKTLKQTPELGGLDVETLSVENGMYRLHCNVVKDFDDAINSYTFTIRDSYGILVDEIVTKSDHVDWSYGTYLPADMYTVTAKANYYDNEKDVILNGGINNIAAAGQAATSKISFVKYKTVSGNDYFVDELGNNIIKYDNKASVTRNRILGDIKLELSSVLRTVDSDMPVIIQVRNDHDTAYFREWSAQISRSKNTYSSGTRKYDYYFYVNMPDLVPNTNYIFTVYGTTNTTVSDNTDTYVSNQLGYLGTVTVKTGN